MTASINLKRREKEKRKDIKVRKLKMNNRVANRER